MKSEELTDDLKGQEVRGGLDAIWTNARVIVRGWSADKQTVFVTVASEYGKRFRSGTAVELPVIDIWIPKK